MADTPPPSPPASPGLFKKIVDWVKANPVVAFLGTVIPVAASIIGLVNGLPEAWKITLGMADLPPCGSYAPVYHYAIGTFTLKGSNAWHEVNTFDQFDFKEVRRTPDFILLLNLTQRSYPRWPMMLVRLPPCGGTAQWTYENPENWIDLFQIWR
jgi:hypothetical protein